MATAHKNDRTLVDAALGFAAGGWPVFPCHPETKQPLTKHSFHDASADPIVIERWWQRWPDAMIGAPTGEAMGAWVLDVDDPALFEASCDIALPRTRRCDTGKGYHLYFSWDGDAPVRNSQLKIKSGKETWPFPELPGCDVRGVGGYVILPPSRHPSGRLYVWQNDNEPCEAPDDLLAIVRKLNAAPAPVTIAMPAATSAPIISRSDDDHPYALAALRAECDNIRSAGTGAQEGTLNDAALKIGGFVAGGCLTVGTASGALITAGLAMASHNPSQPWTPEMIATKVQRGLADGMKKPRVIPQNAAPAKRNREKIEPANDDTEVSEDSIALAFTALHGDSLLHDHSRGRWYHWTGARWEMNETDLALDFARKLARELGQGKRTMGRAATASGVEKLARADRTHAVTSEVWDADPVLLGTPSGTVNLRTGELNEPDKSLRITKQTGTAPDHGRPERWLRFLHDALAGDDDMILFLQTWCGYCLTGLTDAHALLFIYGPGGNGKSVFLNTLIGIMGDYAVTAAMETFAESKNDRHSTELAMLQGARLVTASETEEGRAWAEARIKALTGGDPITARFMRQDNFTFIPTFKLTIAGNHAPSLRNVDDAMHRRFNIASFIVKPMKPDHQLEVKLKAEWPQILAWMIAGSRRYFEEGGLTRPAAIVAATDDYFAEQDVFGQWLEERCIIRDGAMETSAKLYSDWETYARAHGEFPGSAKSFGATMRKRNMQSKNSRLLGAQQKTYFGIELQPVPQTNWND
jgi:P4 family phage/plasmid primase-like protien